MPFLPLLSHILAIACPAPVLPAIGLCRVKCYPAISAGSIARVLATVLGDQCGGAACTGVALGSARSIFGRKMAVMLRQEQSGATLRRLWSHCRSFQPRLLGHLIRLASTDVQMYVTSYQARTNTGTSLMGEPLARGRLPFIFRVQLQKPLARVSDPTPDESFLGDICVYKPS